MWQQEAKNQKAKFKKIPLMGKSSASGLPWWLNGKEFTCQCRGHGFDPWSWGGLTCLGAAQPHAPQLPKPTCLEGCDLQWEKPLKWEAHALQESSPCSLTTGEGSRTTIFLKTPFLKILYFLMLPTGISIAIGYHAEIGNQNPVPRVIKKGSVVWMACWVGSLCGCDQYFRA